MSALAPLAAAEDGLVVLMFVTPPGKGEGETVTVTVEAYHNGVLADLDSIMLAANGIETVNLTNVSAGKYTGTHVLTHDDVQYGYLSFYGTADLGAVSATILGSYETTGSASGGTEWEVKTRLTNYPMGGIAVAGGTNVVVEARSYLGGTLTDGGAINFSLISTSQGFFVNPGTTGTALAGTKVSAGVYQATVAVPAAGNTTQIFMVTATLGTGLDAPSDGATFFTNPFRVMAVIESSTATSGTVKVWAGSDTPIANANVTLTGMSIVYGGMIPTITQLGPFSATTDASGMARVSATWSSSSALTTWNLNVSSGGKLAMGIVTFPTTGAAWTPNPPTGHGCEASLQTDPSTIRAGQTVNLRMRVTSDGTAVASQNVARFLWAEGGSSSTAAGTAMTDASGDFTVSWAVPGGWSLDDMLNVLVECPSGQEGRAHVTSTASFLEMGGNLHVTASANAGAVTVTATYTGTGSTTGLIGYAGIIPGNATTTAGVGLAGGGITAPMTLAGSTWTATLTVPGWLGAGDYTVLAVVTNDAATSSAPSEHTDFNSTTIHVTPQSGGNNGGGNNNTKPAGGFIPGFDGLAGAAALAGAGALAVAARRRRVE